MPSVVLAGTGDEELSALAAVRAATDGYPLRGKLKLADRLLGEEYDGEGIPTPGTAWAAPKLLARLGIDIGTRVTIGEASFVVEKVLVSRPDEGFRFTDLAPSILINDQDMAATGLIQPGSRVAYRALFSGTRSQVDAFKPELESAHQGRRKTQRYQGLEPTGPFGDGSVRAIPKPGVAGLGIAGGGSRCNGRTSICKASQGPGGTDEVSWVEQAAAVVFQLAANFDSRARRRDCRIADRLLRPQRAGLADAGHPAVHPAPAITCAVWPGHCDRGTGNLPDLPYRICFSRARRRHCVFLRHDVEPPPIRYGLSWVAAVLAICLLLLWLVEDYRAGPVYFRRHADHFPGAGACGLVAT